MSLKVKRKQAWLGSVIGAVTSIGSSLLNGAANRKQRLAQVYAQDYNNSLDEASSYSNALNSGVDYQTNYLKQFNQQAKLGKASKLRGNIVITDGGDAQQVSNDTFLLRGGTHEDVNETGNTGIGINVGGNQIEAEGGEVAQEKNGALRIFSAQPILGNGMSPAQAVLRGANKNKVFKAQEQFKRNNHLNDDGSRYATGGWTKPIYPTVGYHGSKRVRQYIAKAEGSDFAGQNKRFKGDAIGAKEIELRNFMGDAYQHLNEGQRDALLSYYYNLTPKTFVNQYKGLRDRLINAKTEQEYNDTINAMKNSINVGWNNTKLPGLRNRRAVERSWFGYTNPVAQQMVNDKVNQINTQVNDATAVAQPQVIEVPIPAKIPSGVVPINTDNNNLLSGNIKEKLINMGNQFKAKYSCGGTARKRSLASRPVKGMYSCGGNARPKKFLGDNVWTTIQDELNGSNGVIPWQPNNHYDVQVPNAITETTPTVPYIAPISETNNVETLSSNNNLDFNNDNSRLSFGTGDYISLGADLASALGTGIINYNNSKNLVLPNSPAYLQAAKLATNYNIVPQLETIRRQRNSMLSGIANNTSSSVAALNRMNSVSANATDALNNLYATKENRETELLNQDALNQQQVAEKNIQNDINYNNLVTQMRNAQRQAQAQSLTASLSGVGQAINNFIGQGRQNYDDEQAMLMGVAASDFATPSRLIDLGVNLSPSTLAGIYRSVGNTPNPGDAPKPEDYSSTTEYSIAKNAYDRNIKAYNNRNAYANLIKSRMSLKNRNRYGII